MRSIMCVRKLIKYYLIKDFINYYYLKNLYKIILKRNHFNRIIVITI